MGEQPELDSHTGRGPLTYRNYEDLYRPGNRVGLPGLPGFARGTPRCCFLKLETSSGVAFLPASIDVKSSEQNEWRDPTVYALPHA